MSRLVPLVLFVASSLLLVTVSNGISTSRIIRRLTTTSTSFLTSQQLWFNQTLDHFSPYDHRKFAQRYYEYTDHFRLPDGPIFLKVCGESACYGIANDYISVSPSTSFGN